MRNIILYIATSLDGFIARRDGSIDWLEMPEQEEDYGYAEFLSSIDTTLMGYKTYQQLLTFGEFPYKDQKNYVFTRTQHQEMPYVQFVNPNMALFLEGLKKESGKDIWLIGGGALNNAVLATGLLDKIILSLMPVAIGQGIPLFGGDQMTQRFKLVKSESMQGGVVQCTYYNRLSN